MHLADCVPALFSSGTETPISALPGLAPAMAINGRCNKPIGPGGGTRRLHQKPVGDEVSSDRLLMGAK
ncbi:hypothetical protein VF09_37110 [Nostoc linckia z9]|nr:hypothetical protein VF09_37110 [Nostoc linckia z9]